MQTVQTQIHWIDTRRGRLFAKRWTSGSDHQGVPIVLLHDSLGCVNLWRDFPLRLAEVTCREVIAYDRLGFGESEPHPGKLSTDFVQSEATEDFKAVCDQLEVGRFVIMGHSVGAGMAVACAATHTDECQGLVSLSAQAWVDEGIRQGIRAAKQQFERPTDLDRLKKHHGDKAAWVLNAWVDTWLSEAFSNWTLDPLLPEVTCPSLILHGDRDEYGSVQHAKHIAQNVAGPVSLCIFQDCGHVPHRACPEEVLAQIKTYLARPVQRGSNLKD